LYTKLQCLQIFLYQKIYFSSPFFPVHLFYIDQCPHSHFSYYYFRTMNFEVFLSFFLQLVSISNFLCVLFSIRYLKATVPIQIFTSNVTQPLMFIFYLIALFIPFLFCFVHPAEPSKRSIYVDINFNYKFLFNFHARSP
jgi:hypothetical protein